MKTGSRSIQQIIEEQVQKWQAMISQQKKKEIYYPVITISREPGSGGRLIARGLAEKLNLDLFDQEVVHEMAKSANVSTRLLETLDEKGVSTLHEWVSSLVDSRHLWPDQYMQHLMNVIGTIGEHGRAVIVGRGANFIIPRERKLSVRIEAPLDVRVKNISEEFGAPEEEARRRAIRTESDRKAFIRKYFNADIADPINYDLVINTGKLTIPGAIEMIANLYPKL